MSLGLAQSSKIPVIDRYRALFKEMDSEKRVEALPIDFKLVENKSLENDPNYTFMRFKIRMYNKRLQRQEEFDSYEIRAVDSLFRILNDINTIQNKELQASQLKAAKQWFEEQERIMQNRHNQGVIRYKTLGRPRSLNVSPEKPQTAFQEINNKLPYQLIRETMEPFNKNWRSMHKEYEMPNKKLNDYKRKILNIQPLVQNIAEPKLPRVTYPRPVKIVEEEIKEEDKPQEENKGEEIPPVEGEAAAADDGANNEPMLGEEPEEPEEEEPEEVDDKLAPKNKLYIDPIKPPIRTRDAKDVENKATYKFAVGDQAAAQRSLEQRFQKLQHEELQQARQDREAVQIADKWSKGKSKLTKELQKRLELIGSKPSYSFIQQQKPPVFHLSQEEEKKYHLLGNGSKRSAGQSVDLSVVLPQIGGTDRQRLSGYESTVEKAKLKNLKKRFSHILNLTTDLEEREVPKSLCQYTTRFKSFSAVLEEHSQERQRLIQMEEVLSIKERLTKNKVGVNVETLAHGICLPLEEDHNEVVGFPEKSLPSNPFMVEKKKKKKKK